MTSTEAHELKAVLWDMDGTLVDTEPYWMAAQRDLAGTHGVASAAPIGTFHAVVAGDMVPQGKPHPAPYLAAAELLGVEPSSCVAVEDSVSGTTSAQAAGMDVVVVPGVVQPSAAGRRFVTSLEDVTVESLRNMLRR